jgi:hypothetical protein
VVDKDDFLDTLAAEELQPALDQVDVAEGPRCVSRPRDATTATALDRTSSPPGICGLPRSKAGGCGR